VQSVENISSTATIPAPSRWHFGYVNIGRCLGARIFPGRSVSPPPSLHVEKKIPPGGRSSLSKRNMQNATIWPGPLLTFLLTRRQNGSGDVALRDWPCLYRFQRLSFLYLTCVSRVGRPLHAPFHCLLHADGVMHKEAGGNGRRCGQITKWARFQSTNSWPSDDPLSSNPVVVHWFLSLLPSSRCLSRAANDDRIHLCRPVSYCRLADVVRI
jgi:hypothetical protein